MTSTIPTSAIAWAGNPDPEPRCAVRMDITPLTQAVQLAGGAGGDPDHSERLLASLRRRGYADDTGLLGPVARLATDLAGATVRLDLWRFAGRRTARHSVWTGPRGAVLALHHHDGSLGLEPLEPGRLAERVTALAGHPNTAERRGAADREPAQLSRDLLLRFLDAMSSGDAGRAATHLAAVRADLPALRLLHGLALEHGGAWSIERRAVDMGPVRRPAPEPCGPPDRVLTVLDAGSVGLWADAGPDRFEPTAYSAVQRRLDGLLAPTLASPPVSTVAPCPSSPKWRPSAASSIRG